MDAVRNLTILQNNINSIRPAANRSLLTVLLQQHKIDIAILSEIWIKQDENFNFSGYKFIKKCREKGYGGVGLLIRNEIDFTIVSLPNIHPIEAVAIKTNNTVNSLMIFSIYIPPNIGNSQLKTQLLKLIDFIDKSNISTILAGDLNAHHPTWNQSNKTCARGELLVEVLENTELMVMNDGNPTTIRHPNSTPSAIDLTIVSTSIAPKVEWSVLDQEICGEHKIILFEIINQAKYYEYNLTQINKKQALENLNNILPEEIEDPEQLSIKFKKCIDDAKFKPSKTNHPKKWWTTTIQKLYDDKNKLLIKYFNNLTLQNFLEFKKARTILKAEIRKEKRKSYRELTDSLTPDMNIKELWTTVKMISGGFPKKNNIKLLNDKNLASEFMNLNFPNKTTDIKYSPTNTMGKHKITLREIQNIINSKKDTSAPGPDNISYYFLKQLNLDLMIKITEMCNEVIHSRQIPKSWLEIKTVAILKPEKEENDARSYRPICLIPVFLKTINISYKTKLVEFIKLHSPLPQYSFGFKQKTSAINCVNMLIAKINHSKNKKHFSLCTFLDLSKAFDNVNIEKLLNILKEKKFPDELIDWCYYYLRKRTVKIIMNDGTEIERITNKGLPQGCPLSPILFNIYTSSIHELAEEGVLIQFADDFAIFIESENIPTAVNKMNNTLDSICTALHDLDLIVNPNKSAAICFDNNIPDNVQIKINNQPVELKFVHRYLGIWIDNKLSFKTHITEITNKAKKKINIIKMLSRKKGGAHPTTLSQVNKSIVRSQIDYGITIYSAASKTDLQRIEKIQNLSLRTTFRYLQSTPNQVLFAETGELPLKYRAQYLTFKEILKNLYYNNSPITESLNNLINSDTLPKHTSYIQKTASLNNYHLLQCKFNQNMINPPDKSKLVIISKIGTVNKTNTSKEIQKAIVLQLIREKYERYYQIFTDGSKTLEGVGYGIYDQQTKSSFSYKLKEEFSIMNAELVGIIEAIEYAISINQFKIVIFTDSQSSCSMLDNSRQENNYLINHLYSIVQFNNIQEIIIQWIPGHANIVGNDRADRAAKLGTKRTEIENYPLTLDDCLLAFKNEIQREWNKEYIEISREKGKEHFKILPQITLKPWFKDIHLPTSQTIQLGRIRTFHTATKERLARWNLIRSELCETCQVKEDIFHILFDCSKLSSARRKYPILENKKSLYDILKNKNNGEYSQIANFLEETRVNV